MTGAPLTTRRGTRIEYDRLIELGRAQGQGSG